ncbi:phage repressor protein CI [Enterobacter ludwigii]|uniref:phage repressor protein CI n=1 Tax=Enterobacter ludwigii TaxID=299767 RepID=UPI002AB571AD|nr:phage repressor protein CI [Enterobacter ludwigii]
MNLEKGGRGAIERMVEAYGFKTRQALCDHLGISKSTLATRYMRDSFPAEWVIQCALETNSTLQWLATGEGLKTCSQNETSKSIPKQVLIGGELITSGSYIFDDAFLPKDLKNPSVISVDSESDFICERDYGDVRDGRWFVSIDDEIVLRTLTRLPGGRLNIEGGYTSFECAIADIGVIAKVVISCIRQKTP